jgi:hypothetical protein
VKAAVFWPESVLEILAEIRPDELDKIDRDVALLERFPRMYPVKRSGLYRGHRWFACGNWLVFYRFASGKVFIRGVWPARIPLPR